LANAHSIALMPVNQLKSISEEGKSGWIISNTVYAYFKVVILNSSMDEDVDYMVNYLTVVYINPSFVNT